jgi:lipopolysaccharide biosynthesis glycosyltransferase
VIQKLQQRELALQSTRPEDPIVLCAADENYVRPLSVTLHSAASSLTGDHHLHVLLMDGGISQESWQGLKETLVDLPISIHVMKPDRAEVADLGISHHITHTAYFRLLAARLLPDSIDKVIYLDSDVLIKHDLTELWNYDVEDNYCMAATDIACPFIDARQADPKYKKAIPYLAAISPVQNWRELGIDGSAPYFNSGVMVINLKRWRDEKIEETLLACLRNNPKYVWCWDQYALNVVFAGQWKELPSKWNQGVHVFEYPSEEFSPIDRAEFIEMRDNPALIHYTTEFKPWEYRPYHPLRETFFEQLDQTAWRGWRPEKPEFSLLDWWNIQAVYWIRTFTINYRKLVSVFA